jgi:hypothetical protein
VQAAGHVGLPDLMAARFEGPDQGIATVHGLNF